MPTFLEICKTVRQECGIAGEGPTTVTDQTGVLRKVVDRTSRAWVDIQSVRPYWKFARNQFSFATVAGQREYNLVDDLSLRTCDKFDHDRFFLYEVSLDDEKQLVWRDYNWFRSNFRKYVDGRPTVVTESPQRTLAFNTVPQTAYTVTFDYWMTPEKLVNNDDVPILPEHYHDVIVWKSVMMFAGNEGAGDLMNYARSMYTPMLAQLIVDQGDMPSATLAYPLAQGSTQKRSGFEV